MDSLSIGFLRNALLFVRTLYEAENLTRINGRLMSRSRDHPFIIYVKTYRTNQHIPATFLQKSFEHSMIQANWVVRLLNEMDDAGLALYDPFIGRLVAIAASIHLEHTLSLHQSVANSAQNKFEKCYRYVKKCARPWPTMLDTVSSGATIFWAVQCLTED